MATCAYASHMSVNNTVDTFIWIKDPSYRQWTTSENHTERLACLRLFVLVQITIQILEYSLLVWLGSLYAPLLPFFGVAANIAQFYVKKLLALYLYTPPKERYSASRTNVIVYCLMLGERPHHCIACLPVSC